MRKIYLLMIAVFVFINFGTAQTATQLDLNGDIIPVEAMISQGLQTQADVSVNEQRTERAEWMSKGPWGGNLRGFATDPTNGMNVVIACGHSLAGNGGMWFSNDGGLSWNGSDIGSKLMYSAFAHPTIGGKFYAGGKYGIYESNDGGATWVQIAYPSTTIIGFGMQTANPDLMIAGIASNQGVKYSPDAGANWLSTNLSTGYMKDFAVSAANPGLMFLAVSGTSGSGLYTSSDGALWTAINPVGSGQCYGIYVDPNNANFLLLGAEFGIFKSTDGGANWAQVLSTGNFARGIVKYNGTFYSVVYGGSVYESTDNGETWTMANGDFVEKTWQAMGVSDAGALFGNWGSIVLGDGQNYTQSVQGLKNAYVHTTVYYADRNELWAGTEGSGIWRSTDMGETWENKSDGIQGYWTYTFAPTNHTEWQVERMMAATNNGIYYTDDFGENWILLNQETSYYTGAMIHWSNPDIMWIGGSTGPLKYTLDGGASWNDPLGLPFAFYPRYNLCLNEGGEPRVLLIYEQLATTAYYSDDLGANFVASTGFSGVSYFTDLSIRLAGNGLDQKVYMSTDQGIYQSSYGETYTISPNLTGLTWSVLGSEGTDVYAGANSGVYHSNDEGQTWEAMNQGIENMAVWDITYGGSPGELFAGTRGYSIYKFGEPQSGKILGFVRDAVTNLTIPEAEISASNFENSVFTFSTPFGAYYSMMLPAGIYDLVCAAEGYETANVQDFQIFANQNHGYTFYLQAVTEVATAIETPALVKFQVYPNPANSEVTIIGNNINACEILNQAGQQVLMINGFDGRQTVNIGHLPNGIYFLKFNNDQSVEIHKLVKE
ncbi:MAG: T9SS type A sorting domain-containing protein [Bacteroidales bacterium]|nr:T9SS type A sorting domain-containing protein [Bacteroidales bacterium]